MAFPEIVAVGTPCNNQTGSSATVEVPAHQAGDRLLLFCAASGTPISVTTIDGDTWTTVFSITSLSSNRFAVFEIANRSSSAAASTVVVTRAYSVYPTAGQVLVVRGSNALACESATSGGDDPPSLTPTWGGDDTLWIAAKGGTDTRDGPVTGGPTGFFDLTYVNSLVDGSANLHGFFAHAWKQESITTQDPDTFTGGKSRYAATLAVPGISGPTPLPLRPLFIPI